MDDSRLFHQSHIMSAIPTCDGGVIAASFAAGIAFLEVLIFVGALLPDGALPLPKAIRRRRTRIRQAAGKHRSPKAVDPYRSHRNSTLIDAASRFVTASRDGDSKGLFTQVKLLKRASVARIFRGRMTYSCKVIKIPSRSRQIVRIRNSETFVDSGQFA
jgi:hypothetical protein